MSAVYHVAQVVTRCVAGSGAVVVEGALALGRETDNRTTLRQTLITGEPGPLTDRAEAGGVEVIVVPDLVSPVSPRRDLRALVTLERLLAKRGFDIVHTHSSKAGALGRLAAHRVGTARVVHTYHGFGFHEFQDPIHRKAYVGIERRLGRITDAALAVGNGVAAEAARRGLVAPDRIYTIPPALDWGEIVRSQHSARSARQALALDPDVLVIGTVGRLDDQKAPQDLVRAIQRMRDNSSVVVWIGSGPLAAQTKRAVRRAGLAHRFRFVGERHDVAALLPAFDIFVLASHYEGLPCAVVEAMHCGLPVVATAVNSVPDVVVPGRTGVLVAPGRPDQLGVALDALLGSPTLRQRYSEGARRQVAEGFGTDTLAQVLWRAYRGDTPSPALAPVPASAGRGAPASEPGIPDLPVLVSSGHTDRTRPPLDIRSAARDRSAAGQLAGSATPQTLPADQERDGRQGKAR